MKIEKTKVQQIIKEEVEKFQKIKSLQKEKKQILAQLNEVYGGEAIKEDSVLDLLPPQDKQIVQQDIQKEQPQGALEEGVGGGIMSKIKSFIFSKPKELEQAAKELPDAYVGKSYAQIYQMIKQKAASNLNEGDGEGVDIAAKIAGYVGGGSAITAFLTYIASAIYTGSQGSGYGIPHTLGQIAGGLIVVAIISAIIYVVAAYKAQKMQ